MSWIQMAALILQQKCLLLAFPKPFSLLCPTTQNLNPYLIKFSLKSPSQLPIPLHFQNGSTIIFCRFLQFIKPLRMQYIKAFVLVCPSIHRERWEFLLFRQRCTIKTQCQTMDQYLFHTSLNCIFLDPVFKKNHSFSCNLITESPKGQSQFLLISK